MTKTTTTKATTKTTKSTKATKRAKGTTKKAPAKPKPAKAAPQPRAIDTTTPAFLVRRLVVENPDATIPQIEALAQAEMPTIDRNTLRGLYQGAAGFLRVARHVGYTLVK